IVTANQKHKDRLFCAIFGHEENKKYLLSLYNALNHSNYENAAELEITTLEDAIYMSMKNDVSFLISNYMNLFEHQSTFNPNMPLRGFLYFARLYEAYIATHALDVYSKTQVKIPAPQYLVFYNGTKDMPARKKYRLSDAFLQKEKTSGFEWTATMLNINAGHNRTLMKKCRALKEYADFIQNVRDFHEQSGKLDWAINEAVKRAEQRKCLGEFFRKNRAEVYHLVLTEYDEELHAKTLREEGEEKKVIQLVCIKMLKGKSIPEIADALETDEEMIARIYELAKKQMPDYDVDAIYEEL
ncbi:MAG: hypothetical protein ACI4HI_14735, partial [Lachnospiraceae bacterium]